MQSSSLHFIRYYVPVLLAALLLYAIPATKVFGAELYIPTISGNQGDVVKLAVTVDRVQNLAGIKLAFKYDPEILKFNRADKTSYTSNMLYVVNDREPGRLVIVMAAAKGFAGENAALVELSFELLQNVKIEDNISLQTIEAELLSDNLKKIKIESR